MATQEEKELARLELYKSQVKHMVSLSKLAYANRESLEAIENYPNFTKIFSASDLLNMERVNKRLQGVIADLEELINSVSIENVLRTSKKIKEIGPVVFESYEFINGKFSRMNRTN